LYKNSSILSSRFPPRNMSIPLGKQDFSRGLSNVA
jgi:hypothetical protein